MSIREASLPCSRAFVALACALVAAVATAQQQGPQADTPHVSARLVASAQAVAPGDTITVGLAKTIIPGWHTYWRNPGDSGLATTIDWEAPAGVTMGDIQWPAPERHSLGPVTNYGYEGEVTLLSPLTVPADAQPGSTLALRAAVSWLVCEDICIPEDIKLELALPVAETTRGDGHPAIDAARARLPATSPWQARHAIGEDGLRLAVDTGALPADASDIWFFPYDWGRIDQSAEQRLARTDQGIVLAAPRGQAQPGDAPLAGVLVIREDTPDGRLTTAFELSAPRVETVSAGEPVSVEPAGPTIGLGVALLFALAGGLILNLMPCVFPVLAMKVLALVRSGGDAAGVRGHGLAYLAGVLASFALLAAVVLALQQGGARLGWGFQFQSPVFVVVVAWLVFAVGLNLSGVFTIGAGRLAGIGQSLTTRGGHSGSFFTGVLAAVVATPCTAPLMGAAIGFAMTQPPPALVAIFLALGLGLALPFVLLAWRPALVARLPRPGAWMERFKQFLAFPMYGAAVWLVWVLALQAGADGVLVAAGGMLAIALAAWLYDTTWQARARVRRGAQFVAAALVVATLVIGAGLATQPREAAAPRAGAALAHEAYTPERFDALRAEGRAVFVNMTAAWCITCLVNEQVALDRADVAAAFAEHEVAYLKGDWTNQDTAITEVLGRFGRSGVPLYVYYPPGAGTEPRVLPQILTPDIVLRAIGT